MDDLDNGLISLEEAQQRLEFLSWEEDRNQVNSQNLRIEKLIDTLENPYGDTPEDILIENERIDTLSKLLLQIKNRVQDKKYNIFIYRYIEGYSQADIAEILEVSHQYVSQVIKELNTILKEFNTEELKDYLLPKQSTAVAHKPNILIRYPFEFTANLKPCKMDEYLPESVICNWCSNCTNKAMKNRAVLQ